MKKKLSKYQFGRIAVRLAVRDGTGAEFNASSSEFGLYEMCIGIDYPSWGDVVSVLTHESTELAFAQMNLRFRPDMDYAHASDGYIFHCDHNEFSEAIARTGWLISQCIDELQTAWVKHQKGRKS